MPADTSRTSAACHAARNSDARRTRASGPRVLVAGVGNMLRGDDGFGSRVAQRLMRRPHLPAGTKVIETGIGGMTLVQELMCGYDALAILDAYSKGGDPGRLYVLEPMLPDTSRMSVHELRDYFADTHYATPLRALSLLAGIDKLPAIVRIFGCEPQSLANFEIGLSPPVAAAIEPAAAMVTRWVDRLRSSWPAAED
ncbi:MAG: hydrogenase maturation protease [Gammaproteobacteria bacterium]|nr:hydrogenase maturation protease [Gammaproteobacteria bacterium]